MPTGAAIPSLLIFACFLLMLLSQPLLLCSASLGKPLYHEEECSALLGFKSSFFSESHCFDDDSISSPQKMISWKVAEEGMAGDCCNWGGVTCDEGDGHVIGLDLSGSCLMGIMDSQASIFDLVYLQDLNLAYNWFNRSRVPSVIGRLPRLTGLNLSYSGFSGEVVPATMRFLNLSSLDLSGNLGMNVSSLEMWLQSLNKVEELDLSWVLVLDGKVPRSLGKMTSLRSLLLSDCGLSGEFPDSVSALPKLEFIDVSNNGGLRLTGFHRGSPIKSLKLSGMNLTGEVWISLRNLTHLTDIDLNSCGFGGKIPSSIGDLTKLETLNLKFNSFHGPIPSSLGNLTNLRMLDLSFNGLSGEISSTLGNLIRLDELYLHFNQLAGEIPSSIGILNNLSKLDLSSNRLSGEIPSTLGSLIRLYELYLSSNQLADEIPSSIGNLTNLSKLDLRSNRLSGEIPSSLGNLIRVDELDLSSNQLFGEIPYSLGNLTNLTTLDLDGNRLSGEIHSTLGNLVRLNQLGLGFNQLAGEIPSSIGNLTSLIFLGLSSNQLSGPLSHSIYQLQNLNSLDLSSNYLTGVARLYLLLELKGITNVELSSNAFSSIIFPEPNASVTQLESLHLDSLKLTEVPGFLQQRNKLDSLSLSKNNISGRIPRWLLEKTLDYLDLSFNNIQGTLPMPPSTISFYLISNNRLSGEITSSICELQNMLVLDLADNNFTESFPHASATSAPIWMP